MENCSTTRFVQLMNDYGAKNLPFLFIVDLDISAPEIYRLEDIPAGIKFKTPLLSNVSSEKSYSRPFIFNKEPVPFPQYLESYLNIQKEIHLGNTFLTNLTFPTKIFTDLSLEEIFYLSRAKYKLLYHDKFVVFSPEIFVRISDNKIKSFPMKGTIDASIPDAESVILSNIKEKAEHNTIIDLIRNDMSIEAKDVFVTKYRYIDRIRTADKTLLQVSSEITGSLDRDFRKRLGNIIAGMLPAGSVTGAPKKETLRIIHENEKYTRGWYTGIFGVYDGKNLDSGVMIRYIESDSDTMHYKSGGGITYLSGAEEEYKELIDKVYVPIG